VPVESRTVGVRGSSTPLGRFWQVSSRKTRKTSHIALFFSSLGVPTPSSWRMTRLKLKALM